MYRCKPPGGTSASLLAGPVLRERNFCSAGLYFSLTQNLPFSFWF